MNSIRPFTINFSIIFFSIAILSLSGCSDKGITTEESETSVPNFALKFSGTNSYVDIPWSPTLKPRTFTVEMWVYIENLNLNSAPLLSATNTNEWNSADGYSMKFETGHLVFRIAKAPNLAEIFWQNYIPPVRQWIHVAGVYNETEGIIYVNGQELVRTVNPFTVSYGTHGLTLGYGYNSAFSGHLYFRGMMDEVRVWDHPRTQQQIQQTKDKRLLGNETGLVGYWNFDGDELANLAYDMSKYNNHGTIWGDAYFVSNTPF